MSTSNSTTSTPTYLATCTGSSVQVRDCGVWVFSGTSAVMISPQLYNGILIALGNNADAFAMMDPSGSATIVGDIVVINQNDNVLFVDANTFEY